MLTAIICVLFAFARFENSHAEDEPVCMSRYDYEHKVLRSIVTMEIGQETLNSRIEDLRKDMEEDRERHKDEILQLQQTINENEKKIQSLVSRVSEVATNTTDEILQLQQTINEKETKIQSLVSRVSEVATNTTDEILQLQQTINEKETKIQSLVSRVSEVATNTTVCMGKCTKEGEDLFTYKDLLAQSTCRALQSGGNYVYAIRHTCYGSNGDCNGVCRSVGKYCFNSLYVYDAKAMTADVGQIGLQMYRYNSCGGLCGPNYCCCRS